MFDSSIQMLIEFSKLIPIGVCIILIFNLINYLLWGGK